MSAGPYIFYLFIVIIFPFHSHAQKLNNIKSDEFRAIYNAVVDVFLALVDFVSCGNKTTKKFIPLRSHNYLNELARHDDNESEGIFKLDTTFIEQRYMATHNQFYYDGNTVLMIMPEETVFYGLLKRNRQNDY